MDYDAPQPKVVVFSIQSNTIKVIIVGIILLLVGVTAIAVGVGLGVGLSKKDNNESSRNTAAIPITISSGTSNSIYSILSAPTVSCNDGGPSRCGCPTKKPSFLSPRIVQGYTAVAKSWPWIIALYINNTHKFCSGFLVSYQHVVTAAHCVKDIKPSAITIYAGVQKLSTRYSGQSRIVSTVKSHPNFSMSALTDDIAVLTLESAFIQTSTINICCLTFNTSLPRVGEHGVIVGWGYTMQFGPDLSDDLRQAVIQVQKNSSTCSTPSTDNTRFCAGYNGTDSCQGDSGSPFMTNVDNLWTCSGIVNSGVGCGVNAFYTRVSAYQSFINDIMSG